MEVKVGEFNTFPLPFRYVSRKQDEKETKLKNLRRKSAENKKVKDEEEKMKRSGSDPKDVDFMKILKKDLKDEEEKRKEATLTRWAADFVKN